MNKIISDNKTPEVQTTQADRPRWDDMKPQFPTVQEQINYWNTKERLEHERVMDIRAESRDATNETRELLVLVEQFRDYVASTHPKCKLVSDLNDKLLRIGGKTNGLHVASNPREQASTTAKTLTQEEIEEREQATCEIYDEREQNYTLLDDGRNPDGTGESYAERNL